MCPDIGEVDGGDVADNDRCHGGVPGEARTDDARKRWAALSAFYRSHGHFLVTNGPYQLKSWSGESASLEVFRDLSYPLGVGSYDTYAIPRRGYVTGVERLEGGLRLSADIETVSTPATRTAASRCRSGAVAAAIAGSNCASTSPRTAQR